MTRAIYVLTNVIVLTIALALTANAQQNVNPNRQAARGAGQQTPQIPAAAAPNPAARQPRRLLIDPPKRTQQQINLARRIEQAYLVNFQSRVGLSDEQSAKLAPTLANYIMKKQRLADQKIEILKQLREKTDQRASTDDIQNYTDALDMTESQQANTERKFYADMDPQLTVEQRSRLRQYMFQMGQRIQNLIQQSNQPQQQPQ